MRSFMGVFIGGFRYWGLGTNITCFVEQAAILPQFSAICVSREKRLKTAVYLSLNGDADLRHSASASRLYDK